MNSNFQTSLCIAAGIACFGLSAAAQLKYQFPDEALTDRDFWNEPVFVSEFHPQNAATKVALKSWVERPDVFGVKTHGIWARFSGSHIKSVTVLFLDSGTHFGYGAKSGDIEEEMEMRQSFRSRFKDTQLKVESGLQKISGAPPITASIGKSPMLSQNVRVYKTGDLFARFHCVDSQLLKVTWFPTLEDSKSWNIPDSQQTFSHHVERGNSGDVLVKNVPILPQGNRAYCGVSALAMVMSYLGLNAETEDFAAAAGISFGSTRGSFIKEVYDGASDEAGFRLISAKNLDFTQLQTSINEGIPVVVWRRWNQQRDFLHSVFLKKYRKDPLATLPAPTREDRATWPGDGDFNHASVVTGFNATRGEVIFSESWSDAFRNRRMRFEELAGTSYYIFYFAPAHGN